MVLRTVRARRGRASAGPLLVTTRPNNPTGVPRNTTADQQEVRAATLRVSEHQVLMRGHKRDAVHQDPKLAGADSQRVEVELADGGVRAEEVMTTKGATGDHDGVAGLIAATNLSFLKTLSVARHERRR